MHTTPPLGSTRSDAPQASTPPPIAPLPRDQGLRALRQDARIDGPAALPPGQYAIVHSERVGHYAGRVRAVDAFGVRGIGLEALGGGVMHRMVIVNGAIVDSISACTPAEAWERQPNRPEATCNQDSQVPAEDDTPRSYVFWIAGASGQAEEPFGFVGPFSDTQAARDYGTSADGRHWPAVDIMRLRPSTLRRPPIVVPPPTPAPTPDQTPAAGDASEFARWRFEYVVVPRNEARFWSNGEPPFSAECHRFGLQRLSTGAFRVNAIVGEPAISDGQKSYYCYPVLFGNVGHWRNMADVWAGDFIAFWDDLPTMLDVLTAIDADGRPGKLLQYRVAVEAPSPAAEDPEQAFVPMQSSDVQAHFVVPWGPPTFNQRFRPYFGLFHTLSGDFALLWLPNPPVETVIITHQAHLTIDAAGPDPDAFAASGYHLVPMVVQAESIIAFWETRPSLADVLHQIEASGMGGTLVRYRVQPSAERAP